MLRYNGPRLTPLQLKTYAKPAVAGISSIEEDDAGLIECGLDRR
jgi:hypothetical protein